MVPVRWGDDDLLLVVSWDGMGFIDYGLCFGVWGLSFVIYHLCFWRGMDGWLAVYCIV